MSAAGKALWSSRSRQLAGLYERLRPRDVIVPGLIGRDSGEIDFHVVDRLHGLSTTVEEHAKQARAYGADYRTVRLPVMTLAQLCERHALRDIDFLKIDVEGAEADVLAGGDWQRFRPKAILTEAVRPGTGEPAWQEWEPFLLAQGYRFALFDTLNRLYVAQEHPEIFARIPSERAPWDRSATCTRSAARRKTRRIPTTRWRRRSHADFGRACLISNRSSSPRCSSARVWGANPRPLPPRWTVRHFAPRSGVSPAAMMAAEILE